MIEFFLLCCVRRVFWALFSGEIHLWASPTAHPNYQALRPGFRLDRPIQHCYERRKLTVTECQGF